jgi:hypothetical protein
MDRRRWEGLAFAAGIAAYFLWAGGHGIWAYFTGDDLMNLYGAWMKPAPELLADNVLYFTATRPLGALFYRTAYAIGGFHPLLFRLGCYALLIGNLYILYRFARNLTGSFEVGVLAALMGAYHARFVDLYCSTGTAYDLLCFAFYFGALALYVRVRSRGAALEGRRLALFLGLYILALDSKELAVTLPAVALAYEWLYRRPRSFRAIAWALVLTVPFLVHTIFGAPEFKGQPYYTPVFTPARYFETWAGYLDLMFYKPGLFGASMVTALGALAALVAWLWRGPHLKFCFLLVVVSMLPLAFIPARGMYAMYVPWAGWAIYAAVVLVGCRDALLRLLRRPELSASTAARVGLAAVVLVALVRAHRVQRTWTVPCRVGSQQTFQALTNRLDALGKRPAPGSRILLVNEPFHDYTMEFFTRLYFRDRTLQVARAPSSEPAALVIEHDSGGWTVR